jgi:hypothetical protein
MQQSKTGLKCPIRIFPLCHPKACVDVFVDGIQNTITLVCSQCDRSLAVIKIANEK